MLKKTWGDAVQSRMSEELIYQRAYELAMSGFHINSITVVTALVQEGFPEAAELLNSELARSDLRDVCARHWRGVTIVPDQPAVILTAAEDGQPDQTRK